MPTSSRLDGAFFQLYYWKSFLESAATPIRHAIMHAVIKLFSTCLIAALVPAISAAPTGAALPLSIPTGQAIGPPGSSGQVYGSEEFLGPNGNPVDPADSAIVTDYKLVPGQTADANLGLYLDLEGTANPQPIRGSTGGTDPGPRTACSCS